jgi:hypothetical protein
MGALYSRCKIPDGITQNCQGTIVRRAKNVYCKFVEFEKRAAGIYLELAQRFSKNPKLSSFWLDMATHEKQHAELLQFCLRDGG